MNEAYLFDSYAIIEILKANENYRDYTNSKIIINPPSIAITNPIHSRVLILKNMITPPIIPKIIININSFIFGSLFFPFSSLLAGNKILSTPNIITVIINQFMFI